MEGAIPPCGSDLRLSGDARVSRRARALSRTTPGGVCAVVESAFALEKHLPRLAAARRVVVEMKSQRRAGTPASKESP